MYFERRNMLHIFTNFKVRIIGRFMSQFLFLSSPWTQKQCFKIEVFDWPLHILDTNNIDCDTKVHSASLITRIKWLIKVCDVQWGNTPWVIYESPWVNIRNNVLYWDEIKVQMSDKVSCTDSDMVIIHHHISSANGLLSSVWSFCKSSSYVDTKTWIHHWTIGYSE